MRIFSVITQSGLSLAAIAIIGSNLFANIHVSLASTNGVNYKRKTNPIMKYGRGLKSKKQKKDGKSYNGKGQVPNKNYNSKGGHNYMNMAGSKGAYNPGKSSKKRKYKRSDSKGNYFSRSYLQARMVSTTSSTTSVGFDNYVTVYKYWTNEFYNGFAIRLINLINLGKNCPTGSTGTSKTKCGVRILNSTNCGDIAYGVDWYNLLVDPWLNVTYTSNSAGTPVSTPIVVAGGNGYRLRGNEYHTLVLYNENGGPVACGTLQRMRDW